MALTKKTTNALGVVGVLAITSIITFGFIIPGVKQNAQISSSLAAAEATGEAQLETVKRAKGLDRNTAQSALSAKEEFTRKVPIHKDIESAARAIAAALPGGVSLRSFNFAGEQVLDPLQVVDIPLEGAAIPAEFASAGAAAAPEAPAEGGEGAAPASTGGFQRVPFTIEVSASSYDVLAQYLDSLAKQDRLMTVVSINTTNSDSVSASVYAFAYMES